MTLPLYLMVKFPLTFGKRFSSFFEKNASQLTYELIEKIIKDGDGKKV